MKSFRTHRVVVALLGLAALGVMPSRTLAIAGAHTTLADFQQNIRADFLLEPFNGAFSDNMPPISSSGNGYAFTVAGNAGNNIARNAHGVTSVVDGSTRYTFTGRPVSAFAATLRVDTAGAGSIGGTITIQTNTGESFTVTVAAASTFFGFTTTQPFTTVTLTATVPAGDYDLSDDVYVGTSGTAAAAADQCADASTVGLGAYPFTTVGAARDLNTNSCNTELASPDVYFRFLPTATGLATADTCGCTFDSILRIFSSCGGGGGTEIACNDDACSTSTGFGTASRVSFRVVAGQAVIVRIAGYNNASGSGTLTIAEHADCAPDYNHSGGLEVRDIFDFLNGWFAGCP